MLEKDMSKIKSASPGLSFPGALTILFIGLKLTGYVTWPWLWVLSPLWLGLALVLGLLTIFRLGCGAVFLVAHLIDLNTARKRRIIREKRSCKP